MTNRNTTKSALVGSAIALLLCFTMLLGTTFAWFTDTATTGINTIKSGNLDVVLEYKTTPDGQWTPVDETTKIFNENALYEPGYTEVVFLRVSNAGNLALKYNLSVKVNGETKSTNVADEEFSLKDYLEIGSYQMDESLGQYLLGTMFGTRDAAISSVKGNDGSGFAKISAYDGVICKDAPLPVSNQCSPSIVAIVLTMPTTVGNEANHKTGVAAPTIDLGVNLLATQYTDEADSFDNQYDKDATYPWDGTAGEAPEADANNVVTISTAAELAAFANDVTVNKNSYSGKTVKLGADIDLNNMAWTPIGQTGSAYGQFKGTFDGNGYTIKNLYVDNTAYTDKHTSSGLFGWAESGVTIQNVKIDGATIKGNHNVAAIVGYTYSGKISNCHVTNATIIATHANNDACGDKAGTIVGYAGDESRFTNCSAANCTVTAGRDAGQVIGTGYNVSVSGCSATNVTVTAGGDCTGANIRNEVIGRVMG